MREAEEGERKTAKRKAMDCGIWDGGIGPASASSQNI
jgi:hypothetical protein